jgi:hypothetical protein
MVVANRVKLALCHLLSAPLLLLLLLLRLPRGLMRLLLLLLLRLPRWLQRLLLAVVRVGASIGRVDEHLAHLAHVAARRLDDVLSLGVRRRVELDDLSLDNHRISSYVVDT